ncbi:MAG: Na+/H+ antiporter subunit E, partial [Pseudomonadota bacterium]
MNKTPGNVTQNRKATPVSLLLLFVTLAIVWLLWSGLYKPLVLGLGVFSCFLSVLLAHRMGFFRHQAMWRVLPRLPGYWWWVLKEIVSSSIDVAKIVLSPKLEISPV